MQSSTKAQSVLQATEIGLNKIVHMGKVKVCTIVMCGCYLMLPSVKLMDVELHDQL
jgi:hypothetical protein